MLEDFKKISYKNIIKFKKVSNCFIDNKYINHFIQHTFMMFYKIVMAFHTIDFDNTLAEIWASYLVYDNVSHNKTRYIRGKYTYLDMLDAFENKNYLQERKSHVVA